MSDFIGLTGAEARQTLRQRKKRSRASCYPCRTRKVKCDRLSPCENCMKRGYPELCTFSSSGNNDNRPKPASILERQAVRWGQRLGSEEPSPAVASIQNPTSIPERGIGDGPVVTDSRAGINDPRQFLGANSLPSFLRDRASGSSAAKGTLAQSIGDAMMPLLGLNSVDSNHPFLSAPQGQLDEAHSDPIRALPSDREIISLFECYRLQVHVYTPIIPDINVFDVELAAYVERRAADRFSLSNQNSREPDATHHLAWSGLVFAVLASGSQFSAAPFHERQEKSNFCRQHAFRCLHLTNFLLRPSMLNIQTLLILGTVLQNDMKPNAAWMLLGLTVRVGQSLGLHLEETAIDKRKLWSSIVWQDSLLSWCFDRAPTSMPSPGSPCSDDVDPYTAAMVELSNVALADLGNNRMRPPNFALILEQVANLEQILVTYARDCTVAARGSSIQHGCQSQKLIIHVSFFIACLCRPVLRPWQTTSTNAQSCQILMEKCSDGLKSCVRAFICLHSFSILASRSWAVIHNGLSSALLLTLIRSSKNDPQVGNLQREILEILEGSLNHNRNILEGDNIGLSRAHAKAVTMLRKLYDEDQRENQAQKPADSNRRQRELEANEQPLVANGNMNDLLNSQILAPDFWTTNDGAHFQFSHALNDPDISPLDVFDSILWDASATEYTEEDYLQYGS